MSAPELDREYLGRLTVKEAAQIAGRSPAWIYDRVADGRMTAIRTGGRIYVLRSELEKQRRLDRSPATNVAAARRHQTALQLRSAFRLITNDAK